MSAPSAERGAWSALGAGRLRRSVEALVARVHSSVASPTGRRLLATTFWSLLSEALSRGLLMLTTVLVARRLGAAAYGQFGIVRTTVSVFATLGGMGLGLTANRFLAQYRESDKTYSGHLIGSTYLLATACGGLVGLGVFLSARLIAVDVLHAPELTAALRLAAVLLTLGAVNSAQTGIMQGLEAYRRLAVGSLIQGVAALVFMVSGTYAFGLNGAVGGLLAYSATGAVVLHRLIDSERRRQGVAVSYSGLGATLPIVWRFSLPVMLSGMAIAPLKWSAETLLARRVGFAELGILNRAGFTGGSHP